VTCVGLLKKYLANICRSPRDEKKAPSARAANLKSRRTPCTSPGPNVRSALPWSLRSLYVEA